MVSGSSVHCQGLCDRVVITGAEGGRDNGWQMLANVETAGPGEGCAEGIVFETERTDSRQR